jgi:hypothetical protein
MIFVLVTYGLFIQLLYQYFGTNLRVKLRKWIKITNCISLKQDEALTCRHLCLQKGRYSTINWVSKIQEPTDRVFNIHVFHLFSCSQRFLNYLAFKYFGFERTWCYKQMIFIEGKILVNICFCPKQYFIFRAGYCNLFYSGQY